MNRLRPLRPPSVQTLLCSRRPAQSSPHSFIIQRLRNQSRGLTADSTAQSPNPPPEDIPLSSPGDLQSAHTTPQTLRLTDLPSPPSEHALQSARLSALHARLLLPSHFPIQSLARTLVHSTADPDPQFNNSALAILGGDALSFWAAEHFIAHYPRLPMEVLFAAQNAYVGSEALAALAREWGVDPVAHPGGEVDPGYLQFRPEDQSGKVVPGYHASRRELERESRLPAFMRLNQDDVVRTEKGWRRTTSARIVLDDEFGMQEREETVQKKTSEAYNPLTDTPFHRSVLDQETSETPLPTTTLAKASSSFVQAVVGALYLHCGKTSAHNFFHAHILSRHLNIAKLFSFKAPTRDLSRLCLREGFEQPVARLLAETGRTSRSPVFVVGVYSGVDKLGEGAGASIPEARTRAAVAAMKSWYLYSPGSGVMCPSEVEGKNKAKRFKPLLVDCGEIIT